MKRRLMMVLLIVLIIPNLQVHASDYYSIKSNREKIQKITEKELVAIQGETKESFSDYKEDAWYAENIAKLIAIKGIKGYSNGMIKPNGVITKAEFIKITVASLYGDQVGDTAEHWAMPYVKKALKVHIVEKEDVLVETLNQPITRQEMAKMATLTMKESFNERIRDLQDVGIVIKDYEKIDKKYKKYIQTVYSKGILSGYPDRTIRAENTATRAEACTLLVRLLDGEKRLDVQIYEWSARPTVVARGYTLPDIRETKLAYSFSSEEDKPELNMAMLVDEKEAVREEQKDAIRIALQSKLSKEDVAPIMSYIKRKEKISVKLAKKTFVAEDYKVVVESGQEEYFIFIEVFNKKK